MNYRIVPEHWRCVKCGQSNPTHIESCKKCGASFRIGIPDREARS